jgi:excisionase family DNA binding protein
MEAQNLILLPNEEINSIKAQLHRIESGQARNIHNVNREYLYTDEEFCEILKCSKKTVQNWRNRGYLGFVQVGSFIRYRKEDILDFCEKFQVKANFKG